MSMPTRLFTLLKRYTSHGHKLGSAELRPPIQESKFVAVCSIEPYKSLLDPLWVSVKAGSLSIVTSELTLLETLVKPLRDGNTALEGLFRAFLNAREVSLIPATLPIWENAARLRGLGLRTPDALHAATAIAIRCNLFVTNDPVFQRVSGLPVVVLKDVLTI